MPAPIIYSTVSIAPPPPNWSGDVRALFALLNQNLQVRNPAGYNTFTVGAAAPVTDSGPWLKDGREWWVWDSVELKYIPQRLAGAFDSSSGIPTVTSLTDPKVANGTDSGHCVLLYPSVGYQLMHYEGGGNWRNVAETLWGTTAQRPASPKYRTKFFDTDIGCEIYWNGANWTTVAGGLNDIKAVAFSTEVDALRHNPGWEIFGAAKGRVVGGHNGAANGYTDRNPWAFAGEEQHTLTKAEMPDHNHAIWGDINDTAEESGAGRLATSYQAGWEAWCWTEHWGGDTPWVNGGANHGYPTPALRDQPHNNMQPTLFLIHLRKAII